MFPQLLTKALIVSGVGGLLCLDRVMLQAMISRPVVAGTLVGLCGGDAYMGLYIGAVFELVWLDRLPVGTYVPPNETVIAVAAAATAVMAAPGKASHGLAAFSILVMVPAGLLTQAVDAWIVSSNDVLSKAAERDAAEGDLKGIAGKHLFAVFRYAVVSAAMILVLSLTGSVLALTLYPALPPFAVRALSWSYYAFPLVGIAVALNTIKHRGLIPVFSGVFLILVIVWEWLHGS